MMEVNILSKCAFLISILLIHGEETRWLTKEPGAIPTLACGGVDLVFLIDTSRSIWGLDFQRQLDFVERVVSKFDIGPEKHQTRVGVIAYAQTFWVRFYLRSHYTIPSVRNAIKRIPHKYGSKTRTEKALKFLRTHMYKPWYGGRKNATHVAILISDGRSQDRKATRKEAQKAKEAGIKIFTIGVGHRADIEELKEIASDPDEYFVFKVGNFEALDSLNYKLPTSTCDAGAITTITSTIPTTLTSNTGSGFTPETKNLPEIFDDLKNTWKPSTHFFERNNEIIYSNNVLQTILTPTTKSPKQYTAEPGLLGMTKEAITIIKDELQDEFDDLLSETNIQNTFNSKRQYTNATEVGTEVENGTVPNAHSIDEQSKIELNLQNKIIENIDIHKNNQNNHLIPNELDRTFILSNTGQSNGIATLSERLPNYTTSPNTFLHQEIAPSATSLIEEGVRLTAVISQKQSTTMSNNPLSNSVVEEGVRPTRILSHEETTTISNEILQGLAAYSIKPITEDQAQIMSNYILRDVPAETYCHHKLADIYFVLDASNSIWPEDFKQQLLFVNSVIDILDVTRGNTRVGVVVYSTHIHPIVMIDSGLTKAQIKRQVNAIHYVSGRTNTSDALRFIRKYGFAPGLTRKNAVKLGIILTDGISRNPIATKTESNKCRKENINLFAVGIGKQVDQTELKRIANDPDQKFMFHVASYEALNSIKDFLAITACSVVPDQPNRLIMCSSPGPMDVVFSYDSFALGARKSQMINFFIHDILNSLDFQNGNLQVGRLTDNCPEQTNIPISSVKNLTAFAKTPYPGVASLIQRMNATFSNREDAKKLGVLFIDDSTEGIDKAIRVIKGGLDFKLMVIGIGDRKTTESAGDLCSYPKHDYFLQAPGYSSLLRARSKLLDKLCTSMMATG